MRIAIVQCFLTLGLLICGPHDIRAQDNPYAQGSTIRLGDWVSVAANLDGGYRTTQFFEPDYDTAVFQLDSRLELWLPPFRDIFAWGPYLRAALVTSSRTQPWENAWLSRPGIGVQVYPASLRSIPPDSLLYEVLGPVRVFAEYNSQTYWGAENDWRPDDQVKVGLDYWKSAHVNDLARAWWLEMWHGAYWQSANEFSGDYRTFVLANAVRGGIRMPKRRGWSAVTPFVALESTRTKNDSYYWENRLLLGGGLRVTPPLSRTSMPWLSRVVIYGEALKVASHYGAVAPTDVPRVDVRIGISTTLGDWYK